jgi:hypothetical protein
MDYTTAIYFGSWGLRGCAEKLQGNRYSADLRVLSSADVRPRASGDRAMRVHYGETSTHVRTIGSDQLIAKKQGNQGHRNKR